MKAGIYALSDNLVAQTFANVAFELIQKNEFQFSSFNFVLFMNSNFWSDNSAQENWGIQFQNLVLGRTFRNDMIISLGPIVCIKIYSKHETHWYLLKIKEGGKWIKK